MRSKRAFEGLVPGRCALSKAQSRTDNPLVRPACSSRRFGVVLLTIVLVSCGADPGATSTTSPTVTTAPTTSCTTTTTTTSVASTSTTILPTTTTTTTTWVPSTSTTTVPSTTTTGPATTSTVPTVAAKVIRVGPSDRRVVALTFDAGSDRGFAEAILDFLDSRGIPASFGLTGCWSQSNSDLVVRMANAGHTLINHTYDHPHMTTLSSAARLDQLQRTEAVIFGLTGVSTKPYFRPPFGEYDQSVLVDVGSAGYAYSIMWTVDTLGWKTLEPEVLLGRVKDAARPGAIVLMHVGKLSTDYDALPAIVDWLVGAGYGFVTIDELLGD